MAIPKAVSLMGSVVGVLLLLLVAFLTWFTVQGLISSSDITNTQTYTSLAAATAGRWGRTTIQAALALSCLGLEVVYIDIIGDVLLGDQDTTGVLGQVLAPQLQESWLVSRPAVLGALCGLVLLPLMSQRQLGALGVVNAIGLGSLMLMAGSTVWLAGSAISKGEAHALPLWPDVKGLGTNPTERLVSALGIIPMILTAIQCHQSVHPLRGMLHPYKRATLDGVVATAVTFVAGLFIVVAAAAYVAFGQGIKPNFLLNLAAPDMAPLIGLAAARAVEVLVRCGYVISLLASCTLMMFPFRGAVIEAAAPLVTPASSRASSVSGASVDISITKPAAVAPEASAGSSSSGGNPSLPVDAADTAAVELATARLFVPVTVVLLSLAYTIAVFVPNVWTMIGLVGSLSGTVLCFIVPAICIVKYRSGSSPSHRLQRALAWGIGLLGAALFVNGFVTLLLPHHAKCCE